MSEVGNFKKICEENTCNESKCSMSSQARGEIKRNNFLRAIKEMKHLQYQVNKLSYGNVSEISETNANDSKEEKCNYYLSRPLQKQFKKKGNNIVNVYTNYDHSKGINKVYSIGTILKNFLTKVVEVDEEEEEIDTTKNKNLNQVPISGQDDKGIRFTNFTSHSPNGMNEMINANNLNGNDIKPFKLEVIDDLDEVKEVDIDYYDKKNSNEILLVDSIADLKGAIVYGGMSNSFKIKSNNGTTERKIPQKFSRSKMRNGDFKDEMNIIDHHSFLSNAISSRSNAKSESHNTVNKNLILKFNTVSKSKNSSLSGISIEKINFDDFNDDAYKTPSHTKHFNPFSPMINPTIASPKLNLSYASQTIYDLDFYNNLLSSAETNPNPTLHNQDFIKNHPLLNWNSRAELIDWMIQICEEFAFKRDTTHYAIFYLDSFLCSSNGITKPLLQLIGITCIDIAAKIEEVQIPKLSEYAHSTESFDIGDVMEYEIKILRAIHFRLIPITINTWMNWYICQWDLFIDTVEGIKESLLEQYTEEDLLYFKKSDDKSYYNYRRICQLVDLSVMDKDSMKYDDRHIVAGLMFVVMNINFDFIFDYEKDKYEEENEKTTCIREAFNSFIVQSFDIDINTKEFVESLSYCGKFRDYQFDFSLPLLYQIETPVENGNYEDFVSYQTYDNKQINYLKRK